MSWPCKKGLLYFFVFSALICWPSICYFLCSIIYFSRDHSTKGNFYKILHASCANTSKTHLIVFHSQDKDNSFYVKKRSNLYQICQKITKFGMNLASQLKTKTLWRGKVKKNFFPLFGPNQILGKLWAA